jgi:pyruvate/2-oxoacid:ferredoxin oxidoreductase beta subunit
MKIVLTEKEINECKEFLTNFDRRVSGINFVHSVMTYFFRNNYVTEKQYSCLASIVKFDKLSRRDKFEKKQRKSAKKLQRKIKKDAQAKLQYDNEVQELVDDLLAKQAIEAARVSIVNSEVITLYTKKLTEMGYL